MFNVRTTANSKNCKIHRRYVASKGSYPKKLTFIADMSTKGGGGQNPRLLKKMQVFVEKKNA